MAEAGKSANSEDAIEDLQVQSQTQISAEMSTEVTTLPEVKALHPVDGILPPLHPSHAIIPIPPPRSASSIRTWYYGWPISIDFVNDGIKRFIPSYDTDNDTLVERLAVLMHQLRMYLRLKYPVDIVYVKPDDAPWLPEPLYPEAPGLAFLALVSTGTRRRLMKRPTQMQVDKLTRHWTGESPRWMEDAKEKGDVYEDHLHD